MPEQCTALIKIEQPIIEYKLPQNREEVNDWQRYYNMSLDLAKESEDKNVFVITHTDPVVQSFFNRVAEMNFKRFFENISRELYLGIPVLYVGNNGSILPIIDEYPPCQTLIVIPQPGETFPLNRFLHIMEIE